MLLVLDRLLPAGLRGDVGLRPRLLKVLALLHGLVADFSDALLPLAQVHVVHPEPVFLEVLTLLI